MRIFKQLSALIAIFGFCLLMPQKGVSQVREANKPNQNNILKFNVTAAATNEIRFLFEKEITHRSSLELGVARVFANPFWEEIFGVTLLADGYSVQLAYRRYFDKEYYSIPPTFRSYISPAFSFKRSSYENMWFILPHPNPDFSECQQESRVFHHIGGKIVFGFQTARGRFVLDLYSGLGLKMVRTDFTLHALNTGGEICEITPDTQILNENLKQWDPAVGVHAGVKIGFRTGGYKEYPKEIKSDAPNFKGGNNDTPPPF